MPKSTKIISIIKDPYFIITGLYLLSFTFLLPNNGIYWDDWVLYYVNKTDLSILYKEINVGVNLYDFLLQNPSGPILCKWTVFISFYLTSVLFYKILIKVSDFNPNTILMIVLLFTLFPYNFARVSTITILYTICNFSFFLSFFLMVLYFEKNKYIYRILALLFFFFSFYTNSFLVFYCIALFFIGYKENIHLPPYKYKKAILKYFKYIDFIAIPIVFWAQKKIFFPSNGNYENYNHLNYISILKAPFRFIISLHTTFYNVILKCFSLNVFIVILAILLYVYLTNTTKHLRNERFKSINGLVIGLVFFFLGVFPYFAVGRSAHTFGLEWNSRDQLLLPLGASFILYFGILLFSEAFNLSNKINVLVFSIILSSFCIYNMNTYKQFNVDWFKQLAFIENIKNIPEIKNNSTFIVEDNTSGLNAINRTYRFYEYSGLMKQAFGDEKRLAAKEPDFSSILSNSKKIARATSRPYFSMKEYQYTKPEYKIIINYGSMKIETFETVKFALMLVAEPEKAKRILKPIISIKTKKIY